TPQQLNMIKNTLSEGYTMEDAVKIIKSTINSSKQEVLYASLSEALEPLFKDKTKTVVGMLFLYKKKMCRNGDKCINKDKCIFLHESEIDVAKSDRRSLVVDDNTKRRHMEDNNEVVFNKVPFNLANEVLIEKYASKFGKVSSVKKLNEGKYLIVFNDPISSKNLMESKDPVMGDLTVTKFYNVILNSKPTELSIDEMFEEQNNLLNLSSNALLDVKNYNRLKYLCKKIKEYFDMNIDKKKKIETNKNTGFSSLYAEHFK
ncbi:hypothetical protein H311_00722, partial [Anncaliia algerae PRA109]